MHPLLHVLRCLFDTDNSSSTILYLNSLTGRRARGEEEEEDEEEDEAEEGEDEDEGGADADEEGDDDHDDDDDEGDKGAARRRRSRRRRRNRSSDEKILHVILRAAFPVVPTSICIVLALLGHYFQRTCLLGIFGSSPAWYLVSFLVVAYPFACVFPPRGESEGFSRALVLGVAGWAALISLFESVLNALMNEDPPEVAWASGYSLYSLVGLVTLPLFFYVNRERSTPTVPTSPSSPVSPTSSSSSSSSRPGTKFSSSSLAAFATCVTLALSVISSWSYVLSPAPSTSSFTLSPLPGNTGAEERAKIVSPLTDRSWQAILTYILLPAQGMALFLDRKRVIRYDFSYCLFFAVLGTRVPDFLAFSSVRLFASLGRKGRESSENVVVAEIVGRYAVSMGYLVSMSLFMKLLARVVAAFSAPNLYARFMFHAQVYYYSCYYILISSAREMDFLFWSMVLSMNAYYVFLNTGFLDDLLDHVYLALCQPSTTPVVAMFGSPVKKKRTRSFILGKDDDAADVDGDNDVTDDDDHGGNLRRGNYEHDNETNPLFAGRRSPVSSASAFTNEVLSFVYQMKSADQDALADVTSLLLIPTLITTFAILAGKDALSFSRPEAASVGAGFASVNATSVSRADPSPPTASAIFVRVEHYDGSSLDLYNLWLRFGVMFFARIASSKVARYVFKEKLVRKNVREGGLFLVRMLGKINDPESLTDHAQRRRAFVSPSRAKATTMAMKATTRARDAGTVRYANRGGGSDEAHFPDEGSDRNDDEEERRELISRSRRGGVGGGRSSSKRRRSVRDLHYVLIVREFVEVFPYYVLVTIHAAYSLFQNPELPTRYAFCSFSALE